MSIVLYGKRIEVPGTACWLDDPAVCMTVTRGKTQSIPLSREGYNRDPSKFWIRGHVTHTTSGTVRKLDEKSIIESTMDWVYAKYSTNLDDKSWTLTKDLDESAIQVSDPGRLGTWHAGQVNQHTDGWELVQTKEGTLTKTQLEGYVRLCDEWSYHCGIPRVIAWRNGAPYMDMLTRALSAHGSGASLCLFYGHCNIWSLNKTTGKLFAVRGKGDPSELPFRALKDAGYLALDVEKGEDLEMWKSIQAELKLDADGIPGPRTRGAMIRSGKYGTGGVLIPRPGDDARGTPAWLLARSAAEREVLVG
jgi:hypothetical protein